MLLLVGLFTLRCDFVWVNSVVWFDILFLILFLLFDSLLADWLWLLLLSAWLFGWFVLFGVFCLLFVVDYLLIFGYDLAVCEVVYLFWLLCWVGCRLADLVLTLVYCYVLLSCKFCCVLTCGVTEVWSLCDFVVIVCGLFGLF